MMTASYTMRHCDFVEQTGSFLEDLFSTFYGDDTSVKEAMLDVFNGIWNQREIAGETIGEQKAFLTDVYNTNWRYYKEVLDNYSKEWDYRSGGKKITDFSRSGSADSHGVSVDLPNKKIDADDMYAYPDSGDKNHSENEASGQTVVTDTSAFIELKKEYLDQIRNVFEEFSYRFTDCFLSIY